MNILLTISLLLLIGYSLGLLLNKIGLPKIIGYIVTGVAFSPKTSDFFSHDIIPATQPLMDVCLAFIAFTVGGALRWSTVKKHEKEIISITFLASIFPFIFVVIGVYAFGLIFPAILPFDNLSLLFFALLMGALASPTAPAATIAVIHEYKAKGKVTDTIMGVVALDDVLGIMLFSLTIGLISIFNPGDEAVMGNAVFNSLYQILVAIGVGALIGITIDYIAKLLELNKEGQWIVVISGLIILSTGVSTWLEIDELLTSMTMGIVVVNRCKHEKLIFRILERYTEDLIFLIFFLLSGLHFDLSTIPEAIGLIVLFVLLRTIGKFLGANVGARITKAAPTIRKYSAGGLLPQAGIVIGLVLSTFEHEEFSDFSGVLLTTIMGATIIHELIGPIVAKYSLIKSGEIRSTDRKNPKKIK